MKRTVLLIFACMSLQSQAQDTLRIMTYNILNYTSSGSFATRYNDMKEILSYVKPDIVICQEVVDGTGAELLLDNAFNMAGIGTWSRVTFVDGTDTDNMLYYNNSKFTFYGQFQITTALRNITRYRVRHQITTTDTAWFDLFSLHLKASSGFESDRLEECKDLCTYMAGMNNNQNIIVGGDFNFYSNLTETGFNWLTSTNCSHRLYDPVNRVGDWNNNTTFKDVHTQSTRVNNEPDGGSTGGLDDRFDWLFTNDNVLDGTSYVRYIPGTYHAVGQDMNHFNLAINAAPTNTAVPTTVADALYNMSDHLPVVMDVAVGLTVGMSEYNASNGTNIEWVNDHNYQEEAHFLLTATAAGNGCIFVYDLLGNIVHTQTINYTGGTNQIALPLKNMSKGNYLLKIETKQGWTGCKFIH